VNNIFFYFELNSGLLFEISHQIEYFALSSEVTIDKLFQVSWLSVCFCTFYNANHSKIKISTQHFNTVYSHFPDGYFPRMVFFPGKTIPGWSLFRKDVSRVVIFPDKTISYD